MSPHIIPMTLVWKKQHRHWFSFCFYHVINPCVEIPLLPSKLHGAKVERSSEGKVNDLIRQTLLNQFTDSIRGNSKFFPKWIVVLPSCDSKAQFIIPGNKR